MLVIVKTGNIFSFIIKNTLNQAFTFTLTINDLLLSQILSIVQKYILTKIHKINIQYIYIR